jgi:hypothetical protein
MGMILDQFGKPIPEPPNPYDALLADYMGDTMRQLLKRDPFAAFGYSRLVDLRGKTLQSTKQYTFKGRSVRVPCTVKEPA